MDGTALSIQYGFSATDFKDSMVARLRQQFDSPKPTLAFTTALQRAFEDVFITTAQTVIPPAVNAVYDDAGFDVMRTLIDANGLTSIEDVVATYYDCINERFRDSVKAGLPISGTVTYEGTDESHRGGGA
jgi:hypothetical protein